MPNNQKEKNGGRGTGNIPGSAEEVERIAGRAVQILKVRNAILREKKALFPRIEECHVFAEGAPVNSDMMFLALSLPIANGLIHFATTRHALTEARNWVQKNWRDRNHEPDPVSTLAALTLIYIIEQGYREYEKDADKSKIWKDIRQRVEKLVEPSAEPLGESPVEKLSGPDESD